jgi:glyoxylase-like metal-dependent hydrolase (beta-lactamase superfamily II)
MGPRYEIIAVRYGRAESCKSELFYRFGAYGEDDAPQAMDFFFYVLRDGARTILVDCGFDPPKAAARGRDCLIAPREALARLGVRAADVSQLLVTHLHWDHVGNLDLFGDTTLRVPQAELDFWSAPVARNVQFWSHVDDDGIGAVRAAQREGRVVATADDEVVVPGIRAITVGGHSAGQQVLVVDTARGPVVLASDAAHLYANMEGRPFPLVYNVGEMLEGHKMLQRLGSTPAHVIPGHDPLIMKRYPAPKPALEGIVVRLDVDPVA